MIKHFLTGDPHFGHANIIKHCGRLAFMNEAEAGMWADAHRAKVRPAFRVSPETVRRMDDQIISSVNDHVREEDVLWCLGDWCAWGGKPGKYHAHAKSYRDRIRCKTIHMVWGNHDWDDLIADLFASSHMLVRVAIDPETGAYRVGQSAVRRDRRCKSCLQMVLCHYGMMVWDKSHYGLRHFFGHSHGGLNDSVNKFFLRNKPLDVGVDNAFNVFGEYRPFTLEEAWNLGDR